MNVNKTFKIILSIGVGLILGSLLVYKLNELNSREGYFFADNSSTSNVAKNTLNAAMSDRVLSSSNNRHGKLSNYPATREDVYVVNKSVATVKKLAATKDPKYFARERTIAELENRGYLALNEIVNIGEYKARGLRNYKVFSPTALKKHDEYNFAEEQKKRTNPGWTNINSDVVLTEENIGKLRAKTVINGDLYVRDFDFVKLPSNIRVRGNLHVINSRGVLINENTTIDGNVFVRGATSSLKRIVKSVKIVGQVFVRA